MRAGVAATETAGSATGAAATTGEDTTEPLESTGLLITGADKSGNCCFNDLQVEDDST